MFLEKLKGLALDRMTIDEGVEILAAAEQAKTTYDRLGLPKPDWLVDGMQKLEEDLRRRQRDAVHAELKKIEGRRATLRTREEERAELDQKEAKLRAQLGLPADGNA